jgi:hypothetical protein
LNDISSFILGFPNFKVSVQQGDMATVVGARRHLLKLNSRDLFYFTQALTIVTELISKINIRNSFTRLPEYVHKLPQYLIQSMNTPVMFWIIPASFLFRGS